MSTTSPGPSGASGPAPSSGVGTLKVELPHWTVDVRVYDNMMKPVQGMRLVSAPELPGGTRAEASLPPGIYEIVLSLKGEQERQLASVRPGKVTTIHHQAWEKVRFVSTAPLADSATSDAKHMDAARHWSRTATWHGAPGGSSRLFVFVRTLADEPTPAFAEGLSLLSSDGVHLVALSGDAVVLDMEAGFMAFQADLPPGYYLLHSSSPEVRYQPLQLSAAWETQVFILARPEPSLRSLAIKLAPRGAGFHAHDDSAVAAEVVMDRLWRNRIDEPMLAGDRLEAMLRHENRDPWLAVLAAYALIPFKSSGTRTCLNEEEVHKGAALFDEVIQFLKSRPGLEDHPDIRALALLGADSGASSAPFWCPPTLRAGLRIVQDHATRSEDAIPVGSLTEHVLEGLVADSPWTAWQKLEGSYRTLGDPIAPIWESFELQMTRSPREMLATFVQTAPPKFPVYQFDEVLGASGQRDPAPGHMSMQDYSPPTTLSAIADAPFLQVAQDLTNIGFQTGFPEKVSVDVAGRLDGLLSSVDPSHASRVSGLPLSRTGPALTRLKAHREQLGTLGPGGPKHGSELSVAEQTVFEYALFQSKGFGYSPPPTQHDAVPTSPLRPPQTAKEHLTIEGHARSLRDESDRLLGILKAGGDAAAVHDLASRLRGTARDLLSRADFVLLTDVMGRISYSNGAFLLAAELDATSAEARQQAFKHAGRAWEKALFSAPLGRSELPDPLGPDSPRRYELHRTEFQGSTPTRVRSYLNVMRQLGAAALTPEMLEKIAPLLSLLRQKTVLWALTYERKEEPVRTRSPRKAVDLEERRRMCIDGICALLDQIEEILSGSPGEGGASNRPKP
jgi:hypothetical protein